VHHRVSNWTKPLETQFLFVAMVTSPLNYKNLIYGPKLVSERPVFITRRISNEVGIRCESSQLAHS